MSKQRKPATQAQVLSFLAGLASCAKDTSRAQGYLCELLALLAFGSNPTQGKRA